MAGSLSIRLSGISASGQRVVAFSLRMVTWILILSFWKNLVLRFLERLFGMSSAIIISTIRTKVISMGIRISKTCLRLLMGSAFPQVGKKMPLSTCISANPVGRYTLENGELIRQNTSVAGAEVGFPCKISRKADYRP